MTPSSAVPALGVFLDERRFPLQAVAVLTDLDESTVSRIVNGKARPRPTTIVRLALGLGVGARRMKAMCDAAWDAAHQQETAQ
jgi:transcriptional regulator with XRE-family HTH domain